MNKFFSLFKNVYFVTDVNGDPQGLDKESGGYPYDADTVGEVKFWYKKDDVEKYLATLNWREEKYFLNQVIDIKAIKL